MLKFVSNCRRVNVTKNRDTSVNDLSASTELIIKIIQAKYFCNEIKQLKGGHNVEGTLSTLSPFLDAKGILRVGGRISRADVPYNKKHPAFLPRHHHVTDIIIRELHLNLFHAGTQVTLCALRENYWLLNGRQYVKNLIHKCVTCKRFKPNIPEYVMGDLPKNRINFVRSFLHVGVDFCGPLFIKEKRFRNRNKIKIYIAVFVCFSSKAVHLELVEDLSTNAFMSCLKRFFSRRGKPSDIYSDNATNFVGTKRKINNMYRIFIDAKLQNQISDNLATEGIRWHFIPPKAPHLGGPWEAAVKSVKFHLMHVAKNTLLSYEALLTFIYEIEAILNSRPLVSLASDQNDLTTLTPGHLLIGAPLTSLPELNTIHVNASTLSTWEQIKRMRQHFWNRWNNEYLHSLTVRRKWHLKNSRKIQEGDVVILKEINSPPMNWPLARIVATYPGLDGIVRVVTVKNAKGEFKRAVKGLAPLPVDTSV